MGIGVLFILAIGLSMDAFAVAVCKGLATQRITLKNAAWIGVWFGGFQALMPLIGYLLGVGFQGYIESVDHWVSFLLLGFLGVKMIREALGGVEEADGSLSSKHMLILALATSIDALAVGITFAFLKVQILPAVTLIGVTTFLLSAVGFKIGNIFGAKYKTGAELVGGIILILLGVKILLEHLGVL